MRAAVASLIGTLALGAVPPADANGGEVDSHQDCVERTVGAVERRYREIRDLRARFVQITRSIALGTGAPGGAVPSRGTVAFAKPGKMRWSYEEPEPSLVVSDGTTLWLYDPARREVQRLPVGEGYLSGAAIQFLLGAGDLLRDFRVTALSCADRAVALELVPRRDASYEKLQVLADPVTGDLLETTIFDLLGNVTEVAFTDIRANLDPPPDAFSFEPPAGVRVIDLDAALRP